MTSPRFARAKQYCKYWKACVDFRRSECDDLVMDTKGCWKYKERENKEKEEKEKNERGKKEKN